MTLSSPVGDSSADTDQRTGPDATSRPARYGTGDGYWGMFQAVTLIDTVPS